jgi:phosphoribosylformimino-5-aminoimidazole carboxamide ribotide isomerase
MKHMRIIGVIDILHGRAVNARAGERAAYLPIEHAAGVRIDGSVESLARVYVEMLGVRELYIADLDAIARGVSVMNRQLVERVVSVGAPVWIDAGVSMLADASRVVEAGASTVIVGLETLSSFEALAEISGDIGENRVAFSLDLRNGVPVVMPNVAFSGDTPETLAQRATRSGVESVVVLDLARVGMGAGVDGALMGQVRAAVPSVALFAGGGVRSRADLDALASLGVDGALVATALLDGSLKT